MSIHIVEMYARPAIKMPTVPPRGSGAAGGFTFIEILIVVLVLGVASTLVVPMIGQTQSARLRAAADIFVADVAYAQAESIAHGDDTRVVVFNAPTGYHLAASSDTATPLTNPVGKLPYAVTFGSGRASSASGVTLATSTVGVDNTLGFGIYGQLDQATQASVTFSTDDYTLTVTIDPVSGEATIGAISGI